jgi:hypothetical protein
VCPREGFFEAPLVAAGAVLRLDRQDALGAERQQAGAGDAGLLDGGGLDR